MRRSLWPAALLVGLAAVVTWYPTWSAPYAEDDFLFLEAVSREDAPDALHYLTHEGVMDHHFRPLADPLAFALLYTVFGAAPIGYHVLLFATHLVVAWLVLLLARELEMPEPAPLVAALIYVTRDFAFPSLVWASGFADVGSAAAALCALLVMARWSRSGGALRLVGAACALVAAQLTKETAVVTLALVAVVLTLRRVSLRRTITGLLPLALPALALAVVQLRMARFAEAGGQTLYELSLGTHVLTAWPVYAVWSFVGVRELLDATALRVVVVGLAYAGALWLAIVTRRGAASRHDVATRSMSARTAWLLGVAWLIAGVAPALLAPQRVHTNYLALAAVGPVIALAGALVSALTWGPRRRAAAVALGAAILAGGPVLAHLKAGGHLASGGWVDGPKAQSLAAVVEGVHAELPDPPPAARLLVFGGMSVDVRVLGDPRGEGFGPQQVLASALRVRYDRGDLEVLSLPPVDASPPNAYEAVGSLIRERPRVTFVLAFGDTGVCDLTETALTAAGRGDARDLRDALAGAYRSRAALPIPNR